MLRCKCLDRGLCADRCKDRCDEISVMSSEYACAGVAVFGCDVEFEHGWNYNGRDQRIATDRRIYVGKNHPIAKLARFMMRLSDRASAHRNWFGRMK